MTDAVRRMLMGLAQDDYMKEVERRKAEERELEAEVERIKEKAAKDGYSRKSPKNNK